jgi:hypothetical protein
MQAAQTPPDKLIKEARLSSILKRAKNGKGVAKRVAQHNVLFYILKSVRDGCVPHARAINILKDILCRAHKKRDWAFLKQALCKPTGTDLNQDRRELHHYLVELYHDLHTEKRARMMVSLRPHGAQIKETPDYLREAALEVQLLKGNNKIGNTIVSVARKFGLSKRTLERAYADLKRE